MSEISQKETHLGRANPLFVCPMKGKKLTWATGQAILYAYPQVSVINSLPMMLLLVIR